MYLELCHRAWGKRGALVECAVPIYGPLQSLCEAESLAPAQVLRRFCAIQAEVSRFVRRVGIWLNPQISLTPDGAHSLRHVGHRDGVVHTGSEIPSICVWTSVLIQLLAEQKVTAERLEYVLPRADRCRATNHNRHIGGNATNHVWNETILGPVAAANDVSSASTGYGN